VLDLFTTLRPWALLRTLHVHARKLGRAARAKPVGRAKIGAPYDDIDDEFHAAYERARVDIEGEIPVLVVLADELVLLQGGQRKSWSFAPESYHLIKMISHAPLAIFSALQPGRSAAQVEDAMGRRVSMLGWLEDAALRLDERAKGLRPEVIADLRAVLSASAQFLEHPRSEQSAAAVNTFAAGLGPVLLRLIDAATQLQLDALHTHVQEALGDLSVEAKAQLEVIVTGNHQARVRSLPMQYFKRRFNEPASTERRVVYAEGVDNERDALALVGTRRLDRALSRAFFGEPWRMQRDLLGDSAQAKLEEAQLAPIA
jgi:hypothetical protein